MKLPSRNSVTGQVLRLMLDGKAVYVYHLVSVSHSAGLELDAEKRRSFAPFALEPMTTDTWHQPEKRLQSDVPFTCGGDR